MGKLEKLLKESIKADDAFISVEKKGNNAKVNVRIFNNYIYNWQ